MKFEPVLVVVATAVGRERFAVIVTAVGCLRKMVGGMT